MSKLFVTLLLIGLASTGCAVKKQDKKSGQENPSASITDSSDVGDVDFSKAGPLEVNGTSDENKAGALRSVFFPLDSSEITGDTKASLENNAAYLKQNKSVKIQVEGHCDERGGVQYNLALGERRAKSVKDYLVDLGVTAARISTISFGKEKPVALGHDEDSWAKNRRANFVVISK
jgi:peptidoglycan-associated lipoprotein